MLMCTRWSYFETLNEEPGECAERAVDSARTLGKRRARENKREGRKGRSEGKEEKDGKGGASGVISWLDVI